MIVHPKRDATLLVAMSGSLRARSSNTALLGAAAALAPAGTTVEFYTGLGALPHFNPDLEGEAPPAAVAALRSLVGRADGLLISCPEYARGIPGSFKNMLDWLVGSVEFPNKPVAILNASQRAVEAQAALRLVLATMSADLVEEASITAPLLGGVWSADAIASDRNLEAAITAALNRFVRAIRGKGR